MGMQNVENVLLYYILSFSIVLVCFGRAKPSKTVTGTLNESEVRTHLVYFSVPPPVICN